ERLRSSDGSSVASGVRKRISRRLTNNQHLGRSINVMADDYVANEFGSAAAKKTKSGRGKSEGRRARVSSGAKSASILRKSAASSKTRSVGAGKKSSSSRNSNPSSRSRSVKSATKTARKTVSSARGKASRASAPLMSSASRSSRKTSKKQSSRAKKS